MKKMQTMMGGAVAVMLTVLAFGGSGALPGLGSPARASEGGNWKNVTLLYLSDVQGKIEHCGCKSKKRGGLDRRVTYLDSVWDEGVPVLMLDGGDLFGKRNKNERHQTEFLCEVTGELGFDGIGLGEADLNYGLDFLRQMIAKNKLPFTNANVVDAATGELILPEYLIVEKNGIKFGLVSVLAPDFKIITMTDADPGLEVKDPVTVLRELVPRLREQVDTVVLMGHLGDGRTKSVVHEVKGIDITVLGHSRRIQNSERIFDDTVFLAAPYEGRYMGRADLFIDEAGGKVMAVDVTLTSLHETIDRDADMLRRVEQYKESFEEYQQERRAAFPRDKGDQKETFLGARSCKGCHEDTWAAFTESSHSQAFSTLRHKGQSDEPECIVCHTTGYQWQNGYSKERPFNSLANVQCEACHGYGTEHSRGGQWGQQARESCAICHDEENSPDFDFAVYWEKIKH